MLEREGSEGGGLTPAMKPTRKTLVGCCACAGTVNAMSTPMRPGKENFLMKAFLSARFFLSKTQLAMRYQMIPVTAPVRGNCHTSLLRRFSGDDASVGGSALSCFGRSRLLLKG
jgi:hypothetical protein